jgi:uncharacterized protein (TIGR03032 family)
MTYGVTSPASAGTSQTAAPSATALEDTKISVSRGLASWLTKNLTSFAFTSYQSGRLFLAGTMPDGTVSVNQQAFSRAMGICWDRNGLWLASKVQLWRLENILPEGMTAQGQYDLSLIPRRTFITGNIDVHEIAVDGEGRPIFVNTSFSCLATLDPIESFRPIWKPPFISELVREDRCHMNGLGMLDGKARYVTAVGQTDVADGWHGRPLPKGVIIDVETDRTVTDQLSMPHSPRVSPDGKLYAVDSGRGFLVEVDKETGNLRDVAFCPGFLRGLAIINGYALVTVSKPRYGTFEDMQLGDQLAQRSETPMCGVLVIDLSSGQVVEWLKLEGDVQELFTVELMPGIKCPMSVGPATAEFPETITFDADIQPLKSSGGGG